MRRSVRSVLVPALFLGTFVAAAVTASAGTNVGLCAPASDTVCHDLIRSLSLRMGIASGVATVIVLLMIVGMARMIMLDEEQRSGQV